MPVRKPSPNSRSFSRVTTSSARTSTTKRTISFSVSNSDHRQSKKDSKTTKKLQQLALSSKNFPTTVVIQKNNSLLRRRRLPSCSVRTIAARISANNNGCSNCTLIRSSSSGSSRIKWFCTPGRPNQVNQVWNPNPTLKKTSENCEWAKVSAEPPFSPPPT